MFEVDQVVIATGAENGRPIVIAPAARSATEGVTLSFQVRASDPEGEPISGWNVLNLPPGATFVPEPGDSSRIFTWTPGFDSAPGPYDVKFIAFNSLADTATTSITVTNVDRAPVISATAFENVAEGATLNFQVTVTDPDGDPISALSATDLPPDASFTTLPDHSSGTFNWTPTYSEGGQKYTVTFIAQNDLADTTTTSITVTPTDRVPEVTTSAGEVVAEGQTVSFTVTAFDADGEVISSLFAQTSRRRNFRGERFPHVETFPDAGLQHGPVTHTSRSWLEPREGSRDGDHW